MFEVETIEAFVLAVGRSLSRSRLGILTIAATYALSVTVGIAMAHTGNELALTQRDRIVGKAHESDQASIAYLADDRLRAAAFDFSGNLQAGARQTLVGLLFVGPYPLAAYQGWVGGIVSVDGAHSSRLAEPKRAVYYISVLILQLIPYSLAGGAGVTLGLAYFRPKPYHQGRKWLGGYPTEALLDVLRIYVLIAPLFAIASFWEFAGPLA